MQYYKKTAVTFTNDIRADRNLDTENVKTIRFRTDQPRGLVVRVSDY